MSRKFLIIPGTQHGMFATILVILQYLRRAEIRKQIPIIYWLGGQYYQPEGYNGSKRNVWEYYFKPVSKFNAENLFSIIQKNYCNLSINHPEVEVAPAQPPKQSERLQEECEECYDNGRFPPQKCLHNPSVECRQFIHKLIQKYIKPKKSIHKKVDAFYENNMEGYMF